VGQDARPQQSRAASGTRPSIDQIVSEKEGGQCVHDTVIDLIDMLIEAAVFDLYEEARLLGTYSNKVTRAPIKGLVRRG
jgi:hypothetical protein